MSVEQFAISILTEAVEEPESSPARSCRQDSSHRAESSQVRPATANLADVLHAAQDDPCFDLESWNASGRSRSRAEGDHASQ